MDIDCVYRLPDKNPIAMFLPIRNYPTSAFTEQQYKRPPWPFEARFRARLDFEKLFQITLERVSKRSLAVRHLSNWPFLTIF